MDPLANHRHAPTLEQRTFCERAANNGGWNVAELRALLKADTYRAQKNRPTPLTAAKTPSAAISCAKTTSRHLELLT